MSPDAFIGSETIEAPPMDAVQADMRLKRCGLVYYEDQLNGHRWVGPAGSAATRLFPNRLKVTALYLTVPKPGLEITALDGERYVLEKDFKGDWFSVVSPKNVPLIAE